MNAQSIFQEYLSSPAIFKKNRRDVLRPEYVPDELPHREEEIRQLASIMATALRGNRPSNVLIFGKTGTGKTATVKYIDKEIRILREKNSGTKNTKSGAGSDKKQRGVGADPGGLLNALSQVHHIYINCEIVDTPYGVLQNIGNRFIDVFEWRIPFTGWPLERVYEYLQKWVDRTHLFNVDLSDSSVKSDLEKGKLPPEIAEKILRWLGIKEPGKTRAYGPKSSASASSHPIFKDAEVEFINESEYTITLKPFFADEKMGYPPGVLPVPDGVAEKLEDISLPDGKIIFDLVENKKEMRVYTHLPRVVVVVLDEVDKLVYKSGDDVLYHIIKLNDDLKKAKISIIGISNDLKFTEFLDPRVKSRLGEEKLIFPPYNAKQLTDILRQRAKIAFEDGVLEPGVIELCAAIGAREHGDARRALDLLRVAGEIAERERRGRVTEQDVKKAQNQIELDCIREVMRTLPDHSRIVLLGIYYNSIAGRNDLTTGEVYDAYKQLCQEMSISPLTQRRVTDLISELDMLGLIHARIISKGKYGRTREISLSVPPKEVWGVLSEEPMFKNARPPVVRAQSTLVSF